MNQARTPGDELPSQASSDLPVDPDVPPEDSVTRTPSVARTRSGRRRAAPGALTRRVTRAVVRRRDVVAVVALGGGLGSVARWALAELWPHQPDQFPWSTFVENVSGSFLLGVLMVFVVDVWPPSRYVRPFLGVGILGGYTTFSTYMLDTRALLVAGRPGVAGLYLFGTLLTGFLAVWTAILLARGLVRLAQQRRWRRADRRTSETRPGRPPGDGSRATQESRQLGSINRETRASRRMP